MLYEIRDYHYRRDIFDAYKAWAEEHAVPVLRKHMDVLGFWIDGGIEPDITGTDPIDSPIGSANVTWIIRWASMDARNQGHKDVFGGAGWQDIWAKHPDANGYLQMEARFADEM